MPPCGSGLRAQGPAGKGPSATRGVAPGQSGFGAAAAGRRLPATAPTPAAAPRPPGPLRVAGHRSAAGCPTLESRGTYALTIQVIN